MTGGSVVVLRDNCNDSDIHPSLSPLGRGTILFETTANFIGRSGGVPSMSESSIRARLVGPDVLPRRTIFAIDDDPGMLRSIKRLLKAYQFHVQAFESAEAFLDGANLCNAGCLVLDINLSGMSGIELKRKLASSGVSIPTIFITGKDSEIVRKAALEVGCAAYLSKPFEAKQLTDAIEKALDASSGARSRGSEPPFA